MLLTLVVSQKFPLSPYLGPVKTLRAADRTQETGTRFLLVQRLVKGMNEEPDEKYLEGGLEES